MNNDNKSEQTAARPTVILSITRQLLPISSRNTSDNLRYRQCSFREIAASPRPNLGDAQALIRNHLYFAESTAEAAAAIQVNVVARSTTSQFTPDQRASRTSDYIDSVVTVGHVTGTHTPHTDIYTREGFAAATRDIASDERHRKQHTSNIALEYRSSEIFVELTHLL